MQKDSTNAERGIYAACGANAARILMRNLAFRGIVNLTLHRDPTTAYKNRGHDETSMRKNWAHLHVPPEPGFAAVLGGLDYINQLTRVLPKMYAWQQQGVDIRLKFLPFGEHTSTINWFHKNIPEMIQLADEERPEVVRLPYAARLLATANS